MLISADVFAHTIL